MEVKEEVLDQQDLSVDSIDSRLLEFKAPKYKFWKKLGLAYYAEEDMEYLTDELLCVSEVEIRKYSDACSELYLMYQRAAQHVIDNNLWKELGIPDNAIKIIKHSWAYRDKHIHLYGRFDLAGIINGMPAKLIEFNADTATVMPETAIIQKEQLKAAKLRGADQFNHLEQYLSARFEEVRQKNSNKSPNILLTDLGHEEDVLNLDILNAAAIKGGFYTQQMLLERVIFSPDEGIFIKLNEEEYIQYDFWFKLVPWELIAYEEPELMDILTQIVTKDLAIILNPAYTMIFQSKAIMKILWDLYPHHHLLLQTSFSPNDLRGRQYVKKVIFGREGENIEVVAPGERKIEQNDGDFGQYPSIYQLYEQLPQDRDGDIYQAGIYFTTKAAALSYRRRDGLIIDEDSEFIGHYIL